MKKQSTVSKILNLLNTKGGFKPKDIIKETKLSPASVYVALSKLHKEHKLAKEEDGVYISQTQTSVSDVTNKPKAVAKRGRPRKTNDWKLYLLYK
jgi:DeoR/GlpR family transcriptional regulator of sugar metabolism